MKMPRGTIFITILFVLLFFSSEIFESSAANAYIPTVYLQKSQIYNKEESELKCLTEVVYYEARDQSESGRVAVANVVLNRVYSHRFGGDNICSVVHFRSDGVCEFSWVCHEHKVTESEAWKDAKEIAKKVLTKKVADNTHGSLFFIMKNMRKPAWTKKLMKVMVIEDHVFFKFNKDT